jgi:tripartite motif-containing protein 2/3
MRRTTLIIMKTFKRREITLAGPHFVAINTNNDIIVSDFHNHCVKVFDSEGNFLFSFGSNGEGNGGFQCTCTMYIQCTVYCIMSDNLLDFL